MNLLKKCVFENHNQLFDDSMVHIGQNESISKQDFFFFKGKRTSWTQCSTARRARRSFEVEMAESQRPS
jgi:hypothetical protein